MAIRKGIARYAFERFVRQMAIDPDPLPNRLWGAFEECIWNEEIYADLNKNIGEKLDAFCLHHLGKAYKDLDREDLQKARYDLNETSCLKAFDELMVMKDEL